MINTITTINITDSEALLLQQVHEDIEDDLGQLTSQLGMSRGRAITLVNDLKQKGLLIINHDYQGTWIRLSKRGNRLIDYLWPEAQLRAA